jgi:hypothetical protein
LAGKPEEDEWTAVRVGRVFQKQIWYAREGVVGPQGEAIFLLGMIALGAVAGFLSRRGPLSGWAALALPLVLPPMAFGLIMAFC